MKEIPPYKFQLDLAPRWDLVSELMAPGDGFMSGNEKSKIGKKLKGMKCDDPRVAGLWASGAFRFHFFWNGSFDQLYSENARTFCDAFSVSGPLFRSAEELELPLAVNWLSVTPAKVVVGHEIPGEGGVLAGVPCWGELLRFHIDAAAHHDTSAAMLAVRQFPEKINLLLHKYGVEYGRKEVGDAEPWEHESKWSKANGASFYNRLVNSHTYTSEGLSLSFSDIEVSEPKIKWW